jgi:ATP-dependent RNA helicase DHX29
MNQGKDAANGICSTSSLTRSVQISPKPELLICPIIQVHERSIESDFLLIVLKSLLSQRSDLKSAHLP